MMLSRSSPRMRRLHARQELVLCSIASLDRKADLLFRQRDVLAAVGDLEARVFSKKIDTPASAGGGVGSPSLPSSSSPPPECPEDASDTHKNIHSELLERYVEPPSFKGINWCHTKTSYSFFFFPPLPSPPLSSVERRKTNFPFHSILSSRRNIADFKITRAPSDYYDQDLDFRRRFLGAASINHLCKSMIMENTKDERGFPEGLPAGADPWSSKYVLVIVQYVARLHSEKIRDYVFERREGKTSRKKIKMRLAPEDVSFKITGYSHNAVTPIACTHRIPVIVSHEICKLNPNFFWLGAGEVNLKVGLDAKAFTDAYDAHVVDCTYD